jgi:hypothetical protein
MAVLESKDIAHWSFVYYWRRNREWLEL